MHHNYIDQYANQNSLIHKIPAGVKILSSFFFIFAIVFIPISYYPLFLAYLFLLGFFILLSKVPIGFILKNSLTVIPFVFLVSISIPFIKEGTVAGSLNLSLFKLNLTYPGLLIFVNVLIKSWLSVLTLLLLATTTRFKRLLKGLEKLGLPQIFTLILSFMYRYLFVITDELMRIRRSIEARSGRTFDYKTIGNVVGTIFLRSYERGERVYLAMLSRGFTGEIKDLE